MRAGNGKQHDGSVGNASFRRLVRWWQAAAQEERFRLLKASLEGHSEAPPLETVRLAAFCAEIEAGEIAEG